MKAKKGKSDDSKDRAAGVLLHVSSLPGNFGTGDLGPEAYRFADALQRSGQKYWQLLPLNPTESEKGFSPYSSNSSIAGNTLFISPQRLAEQGLIDNKVLEKYRLPSSETADFIRAGEARSEIFDEAFFQFRRGRSKRRKEDFEIFCRREKWWLDDFALFVHLKQSHNGKPWYEWGDPYRNRDRRALNKIRRMNDQALLRTKWLQFVFFDQWHELRRYCNDKGIRLFGDLPFYISYDSVDVWAYPEIFSLDRKARPVFVAGVPPDYFNDDGQLWGMPVFKWDVLRKSNYEWWINRLSKNMEFFDLLRLDHFRAFADYWAVPSSDKTARNGSWKKGPGAHFFSVVNRKLGMLPFVAEDLGDINDKVRNLRTQFHFPGMKVLHFAFGGNMAESEYIPHNHSENFVVYTGTHDNNTTRGWFRKDLGETEKRNLQKYLGLARLTSENVAAALIRLAYSSVSRIAIIPAQDILSLDERARFNAPATIENNWVWRMLPGAFTSDHEQWLRAHVEAYGR